MVIMLRIVSVVVAAGALAALVLVSCSRDADQKKTGPAPASNLPAKFLLATPPPGAKPVAEVRGSAKTGDQVVVSGIVGGAKEPFASAAAVFTIVDASEKACTPDECEVPWDFCCVPPDRLAKSMVTVEFHEGGGAMKTSARGFHGLDHMKNVVVTGKARRDDAGNVVVVADGIYIRP
jgi:hypothetical protein